MKITKLVPVKVASFKPDEDGDSVSVIYEIGFDTFKEERVDASDAQIEALTYFIDCDGEISGCQELLEDLPVDEFDPVLADTVQRTRAGLEDLAQ